MKQIRISESVFEKLAIASKLSGINRAKLVEWAWELYENSREYKKLVKSDKDERRN